MSTLQKITATPKARTIVENGEQMDVTPEELRKVRKMVYWCPQCRCYHLWEGKDFEDIELIIGKK